MRHGLIFVAPLALLAAGVATTVIACSSASPRSGFDTSATDPADAGEGGTQGFTDGAVPCAGLECKRVACEGGKTTTLSGKVYDPAGANPLYNVMVYIPGGPNGDAPLPPMKEGATCETCASIALSPLTSTLTGTDGSFTLENVPVDKDVPVVIQIGKWRRKMKIDVSKACEDNPVPDHQFRLPKNGSEGDMPQIAVTTGCDPFECLLRGVGIDDSEFVTGPGGTGHVHVFNGSGGHYSGAPDAQQLWGDLSSLQKYDITLLSCECTETLDNKGGASNPNMLGAMVDYLNGGGRLFTTHYHYVWFKDSPDGDMRQVAEFQDGYDSPDTTYDVATTFDDGTAFPKGEALAEWLKATGASSTLGKLPLTNTRHSVKAIHSPPSTSWIHLPPTSGSSGDQVKYFSFNTPISAPAEKQCGRAVFSDLHVNGSAPSNISSCDTGSGGLTPQQRAIEFLLFDLSGCVQDDKTAPQPPK